MIDIKCPRCDTHYQVPSEKAGKKGRCPKCSSAIRVPVPDHQLHAQYVPQPTFTPWQKRLMIGIPCAIALLIVIIALVQSGGGKRREGPDPENSEAAIRLRQAEGDLMRLEQLAERFERYSVRCSLERCLRARHVLQKDRSYESVAPGEYQIRTETLDARARARAAPETYREEHWRLDLPLTEEETSTLRKLSPEVENEAREVAALLRQQGAANVLTRDALGREVLSIEDTRRELNARIKAVTDRRDQAESELRALRLRH